MTSPLGLTQAVQGGINAHRMRVADDAAEEDRAYLRKRRGIEEKGLDAQNAANEAASAVITQAAEAHKASGATTPYKPGPLDVVRALDARSAALVRGQDFNGFMQNEGTAAAARLKARTQFLTEFKATGDFATFIKNAYATLPDGEEVADVQMVNEGASQGNNPSAATPGAPRARITLKSGKVLNEDPQKVVAGILESLKDPVKTAEREAQLHYDVLKKKLEVQAETAGKLEVERVKGLQDAEKTDREIKGRKEVAGINAGASKYSADKGLEGRKYAADHAKSSTGEDEDGRERASKVDWTKLARESYGPQVNGVMGGTRISDENIAQLAFATREIYAANPGVSKEAALLQAAKTLGVKAGGPPKLNED